MISKLHKDYNTLTQFRVYIMFLFISKKIKHIDDPIKYEVPTLTLKNNPHHSIVVEKGSKTID